MNTNSDAQGKAGRQETALTNLPLLLDALPAAIYSTDAETRPGQFEIGTILTLCQD